MKYALLALTCLLLHDQTPAPTPPKVTLVPIVGEIDFMNMALIRRAVKEIKASPPSLVVFEIDTPGGRIDHMLTMGEDMMSLAPIPTVAYIRPMGQGGMTGGAWSAGAFLAMSCKKIYMYPGTVIGASAPVGGSSGEPMPEKYVSAFREKFRARAEQNGYPPNLAAAMVDKDLEVFEIVVDGKRIYPTTGDMEKLKAEGKNFEWPKSPFNPKGKILTLTDRQVAEAGIGKIADSRNLLYEEARLSAPAETSIAATWSEHLVGFITSSIVSTILLIVGVLGIWIEFKTPGFGIAGVAGLLAFGLLFFGHHLAGLAQAPEILLFVLGIILVLIEIIWFPGVAVFAIAGILCALIGLVMSLQGFSLPDTKGAPWQTDVLLSSVGRVLVAFLAAGVGFLSLLRFLPKVPLFGRLVLQTELTGTAPSAQSAETSALIGRRGHAVTPLHPGGKIEIDGEVLDVVAEGEFVAQGEPVEILRSEGIRIVVGRAKR